MATTKTTAAKTAPKAAAKPAARTTASKTVAASKTAAKPAVKQATKAAPKATAKPATKPAVTAVVDGDTCALPGATAAATNEPKKRYRLLTGIDDSSFCQKVSDALDEGYELYGSPSVTFNGKNVIAAQAVVLKKLPKGKKKK